jgi:sortase A
MRLRKLVLILAALTMVAVLAACGSLGQSSGGGDQGDKEKPPTKEARREGAPKKMSEEAEDAQVAPSKGTEESGDVANAVEPPKDNKFRLTIPQMEQIEDDVIPTGLGTDETLFHDYAAVHLKDTGYPWDKEANVYIAGHRLGFPRTQSHLAFHDLNELENGDQFTITDADGREYTYEVFNKFIAGPKNTAVLRPVEGKNIVSLQTCTLPDYTTRFIVRAELKDIKT